MFMARSYHSGSHTKYDLKVHLIWIPKYRKRVLIGDFGEAVRSLIRRLCSEIDVTIITGKVAPDHIHLFCAPASHTAPSLTNWVKFWKSHASRRWPRPSGQPVWQQQFWDTQMRKSESYSVKWDYVKNNPVRHGLVEVAEDWPFQGEPNLV